MPPPSLAGVPAEDYSGEAGLTWAAVMAAVLIAHGGGVGHEAGEAALVALGIAALVIPLVVLVFVGRIFLRAAKRDADGEAHR